MGGEGGGDKTQTKTVAKMEREKKSERKEGRSIVHFTKSLKRVSCVNK